MIFIRGDTHGNIDPFFDDSLFIKCREQKAKYLIVTGDFGMLFDRAREEEEKKKLEFLGKAPCTILFVDGNHEDFSRINSYPVETWNGGKVHRISDNILHLMRGQVFDIDSLSVFSMGGAYSPDKARRIENISWWKDELPLEFQYEEARKNLSAHKNRVDLIVTHTAPYATLDALFRLRKLPSPPDPHEFRLNRFLEEIAQTVEYKQWFFGHLHIDTYAGRRQTALYQDVYQITKEGACEHAFKGAAY